MPVTSSTCWLATFIVTFLLLLLTWNQQAPGHLQLPRVLTHPGSDVLKARRLTYDLRPGIYENLGPYTFRYQPNFGLSNATVPRDCKVTQANILHRHGARFPTETAGKRMKTLMKKLANVKDPAPPFEFLKIYHFNLSVHADLVDFGRYQSFHSGKEVAKVYPHLADGGAFIRTVIKKRMVESSRWFRQGLSGGDFQVPLSKLPHPDLVLANGKKFNNTLSVLTCPPSATDRERGRNARLKWQSTYAPATVARLNKLLPGANLVEDELVTLMSLCGFETAHKNGEASPWCKVFTDEEWRANEYWYDVDKYYASCHGSRWGAVVGSGWVNELLARLTSSPVVPWPPINSTLDSDPATFPIPPNAPSIFADFTSDNAMMQIYAALGILTQPAPLPLTHIPSHRTFIVSDMAPFAAALYVEKLSCNSGEFVRMVLNGATVPLDFPECGAQGKTTGLCPLDRFVEAQHFARSGATWERCFDKV